MGTIIRVQEQFAAEDSFHAVVSFDYGPQFAVTVRDPFEKKEEEELEWYFMAALA